MQRFRFSPLGWRSLPFVLLGLPSLLTIMPHTHAAPPLNDECASAMVIPTDGPFPYWSPIVDIQDADTTGDPSAPSCDFFSTDSASRSVWYTFTPSITTTYMLSTCSDAPTATTVEDTILAIYTSQNGCLGPFTEITDGCNDDFCGPTGFQSSLFSRLLAGTTYYIVVWKWDSDPPPPSNSSLQLIIDRFFLPPNDTCADAISVDLNRPVVGSTIGALNHYQLADDACYQDVVPDDFSGIGRDVVYTFSAPSDGLYNFKAYNFGTIGDLALYLSSDCPSSPYPATITSCVAAGDRNPASTAEAVVCVPLIADQLVYIFLDEQTETDGSSFTFEVTECRPEMEPNDSPQTATPWQCGLTAFVNPGREVDYFSLGSPPAESRIFAILDAEAANLTDLNLRVISGTNTVEFDTDNNDASFADSAPNIAGAQATGEPTYLQIEFNGAISAGPYSLYTVVQPSLASAMAEMEPNDTLNDANRSDLNYFRGTLGGTTPSTDSDTFQFTAEGGEVIYLGLDADPERDTTPINARLELVDELGNILSSVNDGASLSSVSSQPGNLFASVPYSPAESLVYRAIVSGTYYARVSIGTSSAGPSGGGNYLLSIAKNCVAGNLGINSRPAVTGLSTVARVYSGVTASLTGMIEDADLGQTHTLEITWGDDSPTETLALFTSESEFFVNHNYADLPDGVNATNYQVQVLIRDNLGAAALSSLMVAVNRLNAPRFTAWERTTSATILLSLEGTPGATYRILSGETFDGAWVELGTATADGTGAMRFEDDSPVLPHVRFYRATAP